MKPEQSEKIAELTAALQNAQALLAEAKKPAPAPVTPEPEESEEPDLDQISTLPPAEGVSEEGQCGGSSCDPIADEFGPPWTTTAKGDPNGLNQRYWAAAVAGEVFYENLDGKYYRFDDGVWGSISKAELRGVIDRTIRAYELAHRYEDGAVDLAKILTDKKLDGVCHAVESFSSRHEAFANVPKDVILVANGRLTKEGTKWSLSPERGRPEDLQTRRFPASFDPTAKAPKLKAWLDRMFAGREDDAEACQKQAGACLIGKNPFKKFMIIEGNQDLGKGKLIALFQKLAGRECVETMRTQYLHERFETARYLGKTTITASDVPENFMSLPGTPMLKMITSIDELVPIEGKTKTSMGELMQGGFNVIVGTNFRQRVKAGEDIGAWKTRMVYLIANGTPFEEAEKDIKFLDKLWASEASGIFNWALEGLAKLEEDGGWKMSARQEQVRDDVIHESASVTSFVETMVEEIPGGNGGITTDSLFDGYRKYCTDRGWKGYAEHSFVRAIPDAIYLRFRVSGSNKVEMAPGVKLRGYPGLRLKSES